MHNAYKVQRETAIFRKLTLTTKTRFYHLDLADDHQVYRSVQAKREDNIVAFEFPHVFQEIEKWMSLHYLQINPGKT